MCIRDRPTWSPFKGYTIRWAVTANSKEIYSFGEDGSPGFEYLERHIDGQWYRLTYSQDIFSFNNLEFSLGGDSTGLQGSIVQKDVYKRQDKAPAPGYHRDFPDRQRSGERPDTGL